MICALLASALLATPPSCPDTRELIDGVCQYRNEGAARAYWKGKDAAARAATGLEIVVAPKTRVQVVGPHGVVLADPPGWRRTGLVPGLYLLRIGATATRRALRRTLLVRTGEITRFDAVKDRRKRSIVILGQRYHLPGGVTVVTHLDPDGMNLEAEGRRLGKRARLMPPREARPDSLDLLRSTVDRVVLHTDLTRDAKATFRVLSRRGRSTHFVVDWDGTIYQLGDVANGTSHTGPVDERGISIDLNNLMYNLAPRSGGEPDGSFREELQRECDGGHKEACEALKEDRQASPDARRRDTEALMKRRGTHRPLSAVVEINGVKVQSYGYTEAQYRGLVALLRMLLAVFPGIRPDAPRAADGTILHGVADQRPIVGLVGGWHVSQHRWDPGPGFDWERVLKAVRPPP